MHTYSILTRLSSYPYKPAAEEALWSRDVRQQWLAVWRAHGRTAPSASSVAGLVPLVDASGAGRRLEGGFRAVVASPARWDARGDGCRAWWY